MIMNRNDTKVKKTLVRNCEQRPKSKVTAKHDTGASTQETSLLETDKQNELNQPTLCSSAALASYLSNAKKSTSQGISKELNTDKSQLSVNVTKKLNFHFNDRIYKNLVELNASYDDVKAKKGKRQSSANIKKDLAPNIEDFTEEEKDHDIAPVIPVIKPKLKPVRQVYNGQLHALVASFEEL